MKPDKRHHFEQRDHQVPGHTCYGNCRCKCGEPFNDRAVHLRSRKAVAA